MEDQNLIKILFLKYLNSTATKEEATEFFQFIQSDIHTEYLGSLLQEYFDDPGVEELIQKIDAGKRIKEAFSSILSEISNKQVQEVVLEARLNKKSKQRRISRRYLAAAASLLLALSIGLYFNFRKSTLQNNQQVIVLQDVNPGSNKATLTLANGKKINLTDTKNGELVSQSGIRITKTADGQLAYTTTAEIHKNESSINIIETPKGGQYQVRLPDGTGVWLNAASKLIYPVSFTGRGQREVILSGEAYFEVAHNKAMPFRVKTATQVVEVLGTHFNVNSYTDEAKTITTLEQGSVRVSARGISKIIKPGEQTLLQKNGSLSVNEANLETALAWKNGLIKFKNADIETIMRQVSRWYNVQVSYQGDIPETLFTGGINRNENLSALLKVLQLNDVHFKIVDVPDGKKLIVEP